MTVNKLEKMIITRLGNRSFNLLYALDLFRFYHRLDSGAWLFDQNSFDHIRVLSRNGVCNRTPIL